MIWLKLAAILFFGWPLLLLLLIPKMGARAGVRFTGVQILSWWATFAGWFLLIYPCAKQAWVVDADSIADALEPRASKISRWSVEWLNPVWGNPQEGVSGQEALIRDANGNQMPYKPGWGPRLRAYFWAALRNSADGLKYLLAWADAPPPVEFWFFGPRRAGWVPMPQIKGTPHVPVLG